ncbi:unnamed protein product [Adineta steineri]|uniref:Ricin B lectin domain-containing protein n=1 Tax=Adineta steineri TaxID=433720 RepID=A0A819IR16_9BILA|nr:unnamed protein product [Adineta steineri]
MCSQWLIVFMLFPFLQVDLTSVVGLGGHVEGANNQVDRFGIDESSGYRLTSKYSGLNLTLLIVFKIGKQAGVEMDHIHRHDNENWHLDRLSDNKYRIQHTAFKGIGALGIIKDEMKNELCLSKPANVSEQYWHLTRLSDGSFRLTNDFSGHNMALYVQAQGKTYKPIMSKIAANHLGQHWILTKVQQLLTRCF